MRTHEREQADALIGALLAKGWTVSVHDGEEWALKRAKDHATIAGALASTDADELTIRGADGERIGWVWLIYGNGPGELIADCTCDRNEEFDAIISAHAEAFA